jgi:predicted nucleic acid-binding protein
VIATYLDSSALVRFCVGEGDLRPVEEAMLGLPVTSVLAAVEVPIAVQARFHRGLIDAKRRDTLLQAAGVILRSMGQVGISAAVRREALAVAQYHLLRSLDVIHVASAVVVSRQQQRRGNSLRFCTGDVRQAAAAEACLGPAQVTVLPPL